MTIRPIPPSYLTPCERAGRVERVDYVTTDGHAFALPPGIRLGPLRAPSSCASTVATSALGIASGGAGSPRCGTPLATGSPPSFPRKNKARDRIPRPRA